MSPLDALFAAVEAVAAAWRDPELDRDDVVRMWLDVDLASRQLRDLAKLIADDAADRLADREDPMSDFVTSKGDIVHLERGYAAERWSGHAVLQELGRPLVDTETGELVAAVPVDVLGDVLPGCANSELTSSKWRVTGLARHLDGWRRYRSRDTAPLVIRRGEATR